MLAYVSSPLNRAHDLRLKPDDLAEFQKRRDFAVVGVRGDSVECDAGIPLLTPRANVEPQIFLGVDPQGLPWFAGFAGETANCEPLRSLMLAGQVDHGVVAILAQARSVVHWHERHGFCSACGAKSEMRDAGYRRHCTACGTDHFPRTDPVVIMAVRHEQHMLLGRQASWPPGMYSTLAGFVEPGETLEQAVRREVFEESGVRVGEIRYCASQPWPFPSSLMIGMLGEALDPTLAVDHSEIEDARWFNPHEVKAMLEGNHPQGFQASHPYAIAHHLIRAMLAEITSS